MRDTLIRLAIMCNGEYSRITKALQNKMPTDDSIRIPKAITILDEDYPEKLQQLAKAPYVLFYIGDKDLLKQPAVAVVGSRQASSYGIKATREIVEILKDEFVIVSGMAKGIDAVSHWQAERTIGVLGNGLDVNYPRQNQLLYDYMRKYQLLISEYPLGSGPERYHFPFRNRIIAALSDKIIVTQATRHSGALITVNEGLNLNRDIYALSYPYDDPQGEGCNELIEQGAAVLFKENLFQLKKHGT